MPRALTFFSFIALTLSSVTLDLQARNQGSSSSARHAPNEWIEVNPNADWAPRAGLQVVELRNTFYLMGGRTPLDPAVVPVPGASVIWADVWRSRDLGKSWELLVEQEAPGHWPARAYFQAVTKGGRMYVLGGQNFNLIPNPGCAFLPPGVPCDPPLVPASDFFNDVWCSTDGRNWTCLTTNAGWSGRG
jgi:hypothetical protein